MRGRPICARLDPAVGGARECELGLRTGEAELAGSGRLGPPCRVRRQCSDALADGLLGEGFGSDRSISTVQPVGPDEAGCASDVFTDVPQQRVRVLAEKPVLRAPKGQNLTPVGQQPTEPSWSRAHPCTEPRQPAGKRTTRG